MRVTDTLLDDLSKGDHFFRQHIINNIGGAPAPFLVVDVDDKYRAIIAGDSIKAIASLQDESERTDLNRLNNAVKGLALQTKSLPTHLNVQAATITPREFIDDVYKSQQAKGAVAENDDFDFQSTKAYEDIYLAAQSASSIPGTGEKSVERLKALYSAHKSSQNIQKAAEKLLKNADALSHKKQDKDPMVALLSGSTLSGLGIATLATLGHQVSTAQDMNSLAAVSLAGVVGGLALASAELAKEGAQNTHAFLMEKSPWYAAKTESYVTSRISQIISENQVRTPGQLTNDQTEKLISLIQKAEPNITIADAASRIAQTINDDFEKNQGPDEYALYADVDNDYQESNGRGR